MPLAEGTYFQDYCIVWYAMKNIDLKIYIDLLSIWPTKLSDTFFKNTIADTALPWNEIRVFSFFFFCTAFYLPGPRQCYGNIINVFPSDAPGSLKVRKIRSLFEIFVEYLYWSLATAMLKEKYIWTINI